MPVSGAARWKAHQSYRATEAGKDKRNGQSRRYSQRARNRPPATSEEAVPEREQGLLGSPEPEDFLPDPLDAGHESFFGADEFLVAPRQFLFHRTADERCW
jgi:hypothetical protein